MSTESDLKRAIAVISDLCGAGRPAVKETKEELADNGLRGVDMSAKQPRMIPNPLWCERCHGRGYLVADTEWEPYAVQCDDCKDRRATLALSSPNLGCK